MQLEYGVAPLKYTDGIPTHLAGEWPGKLSCRFHSYRKVIRALDHGIIYNQNEPTFIPKRKILDPGPSPEYVFRPSCKLVSMDIYDRTVKPKGLKYIDFKTEPRKLLLQKKHYFPYKIQMDKDEKERLNTLPNSKIIRMETKMLMEENGYTQKNYDLTFNRDLNNIRFIRNELGKLSLIAEDPYKTARQIRDDKMKEKLNQIKNLKQDIRYVEKLNNWDTNMKAHFKIKSTALPSINNNVNINDTSNNNENQK